MLVSVRITFKAFLYRNSVLTPADGFLWQVHQRGVNTASPVTSRWCLRRFIVRAWPKQQTLDAFHYVRWTWRQVVWRFIRPVYLKPTILNGWGHSVWLYNGIRRAVCHHPNRRCHVCVDQCRLDHLRDVLAAMSNTNGLMFEPFLNARPCPEENVIVWMLRSHSSGDLMEFSVVFNFSGVSPTVSYEK